MPAILKIYSTKHAAPKQAINTAVLKDSYKKATTI
jgi:hypothetical protein